MLPPRIWLGPALMTAVMLGLAVALGTWQIHRLAWKEGILRQIDAGERAAPVPLGPDPAPFAKVMATGTYRPGVAAIYGADVRDTPTGPELGGQLLMLLDRPGASSLLVDRGWVATSRPRRVETPTGAVTVSGFVREPDHPGLFSARDDIEGRRFFTLNPQAIAGDLGTGPVAPFTLVALDRGTAPAYPEPARQLPRPPNNHLSYAITWYGLGAALAVIFALWLRRAAQRS
jgi:surfeit locus 1 family protein